MELSHNIPWYDLAVIHFLVSSSIGMICGMLTKSLIDDLLETRKTRANNALEDLEDLVDEMAEQRAAQFKLLAAKNSKRTRMMIENSGGASPRLSVAA